MKTFYVQVIPAVTTIIIRLKKCIRNWMNELNGQNQCMYVFLNECILN